MRLTTTPVLLSYSEVRSLTAVVLILLLIYLIHHLLTSLLSVTVLFLHFYYAHYAHQYDVQNAFSCAPTKLFAYAAFFYICPYLVSVQIRVLKLDLWNPFSCLLIIMANYLEKVISKQFLLFFLTSCTRVPREQAAICNRFCSVLLEGLYSALS